MSDIVERLQGIYLPHAIGHKDYGIVQCRKRKTCGARYDADKYEAWLEKRAAMEVERE